jgi:predicted DNA-binding transcriptional regulator AlpA
LESFSKVADGRPVGKVDALLRLSRVLELIPVSRSTWYEGVRSGRFPKGVQITPRCVAWRESEVRAVIESLPTVH